MYFRFSRVTWNTKTVQFTEKELFSQVMFINVGSILLHEFEMNKKMDIPYLRVKLHDCWLSMCMTPM